ncbi:MAG: ABC transporter permease [Chloroflexi bacterium]|nr:MAG: ABC transporter permease [Chloroflexota bacterium]
MRSLRVYIITRILLTIPMLFILVTLVFFIMRVLPGDPVKAIIRPGAPQEYIDEIRHSLGLDRPLLVQYVDYLGDLVRLDLGTTLAPVRGRSVLQDLKDKFPATLELSLAAILVASLVGILTGVQSAYHRRSALDYSLRLYSIVIYTIPVFWLGLMLQLIFGVKLGWLPVYGRVDTLDMAPRTITGLYIVDSILTKNQESLINSLQHLILPALTLGLYLSGVFTRLTRSNMLDVLRQDFITAARARGIAERAVIYRHALKNAFIPVLTMMGLQFALLLAGAVLTESTFTWPGLGRLLVERIEYRDFPTVQGAVVFFAILVSLVSLVVDIIYAYLDPRIRY